MEEMAVLFIAVLNNYTLFNLKILFNVKWDFLSFKNSMEKETATHSSTLA